MFNLIPTEPDEYKVYADWLEDQGEILTAAVREGVILFRFGGRNLDYEDDDFLGNVINGYGGNYGSADEFCYDFLGNVINGYGGNYGSADEFCYGWGCVSGTSLTSGFGFAMAASGYFPNYGKGSGCWSDDDCVQSYTN